MLSTEKARDLLRDVQFPGKEDNVYRIAVSGKQTRRAIIAENDGDRETAAVVEIQRLWRGFRTRRKLNTILGKRQLGKEESSRQLPLLRKRYRDYLQWCSSALGVSEESSAVMSFQDYAARVIQQWWRRAMTGGGLGGRRAARRPAKKILTEHKAAQMIQTAWQAYRNKKTFKFYQRLIGFKHKGDPSVLLKSINPIEAKLLDRASGACVRFRLGGNQFPPAIYYKIFTSQSVVDLCSYSPRDYTAMSARRPQPRDLHNHQCRPQPRDLHNHQCRTQPRDLHNHQCRTQEYDGSNWYRRWENNGWRLVSERVLQGRSDDQLTAETSAKRQPFHHSKLQRRADVERKRKRKKIEWMKKLYQESVQVGSSATASPATPDTGHEEMEGDIDDLLEWTNGLNYDDYVSDWTQIATSAAIPSSCDRHDPTAAINITDPLSS